RELRKQHEVGVNHVQAADEVPRPEHGHEHRADEKVHQHPTVSDSPRIRAAAISMPRSPHRDSAAPGSANRRKAKFGTACDRRPHVGTRGPSDSPEAAAAANRTEPPEPHAQQPKRRYSATR